jgi:hypothetical protein
LPGTIARATTPFQEVIAMSMNLNQLVQGALNESVLQQLA